MADLRTIAALVAVSIALTGCEKFDAIEAGFTGRPQRPPAEAPVLSFASAIPEAPQPEAAPEPVAEPVAAVVPEPEPIPTAPVFFAPPPPQAVCVPIFRVQTCEDE